MRYFVRGTRLEYSDVSSRVLGTASPRHVSRHIPNLDHAPCKVRQGSHSHHDIVSSAPDHNAGAQTCCLMILVIIIVVVVIAIVIGIPDHERIRRMLNTQHPQPGLEQDGTGPGYVCTFVQYNAVLHCTWYRTRRSGGEQRE